MDSAHLKSLQGMQNAIAMFYSITSGSFKSKPIITLQEYCSGAWRNKPEPVPHRPDIVHIMCDDYDFEIMIVVGEKYRDQATRSIYLNAYILPLVWNRPRPLVGEEPFGFHRPDIYDHYISKGESDLWRQALPVFIDKARKTWQHEHSCKYTASRSIDVIDFNDEYTICDCGEGQDLEELPEKRKCDSQQSTRALIPLPYELPHLKPVGHRGY